MNKARISVTPTPFEPIEQGDRAGWAALYRMLEHRELDIAEIGNLLYLGHAIAPQLNGWRSYSHFIAGQHIGIDLDEGTKACSISSLIDHDLVQMYGAVIHSTKRSTPSAPRSRVIFLLDRPIFGPYEYKAAIKTLSAYFPGYDRASAEATRTFWGNRQLSETHNVNGIFISNDSRLPLADLRAMYNAQKQAAEAQRKALPDYSGSDLNVDKMLRTVILRAAEGQRNALGYWMACRMVENDIPQHEAEAAMRHYAESVPQAGAPYTVDEALASLRSAQTGANV